MNNGCPHLRDGNSTVPSHLSSPDKDMHHDVDNHSKAQQTRYDSESHGVLRAIR